MRITKQRISTNPPHPGASHAQDIKTLASLRLDIFPETKHCFFLRNSFLLIMTFYVRDLNNFMTVQDFLFLPLWMIQDFWVVRVSLNQSVSALRVFRRGSVLRFQVFSIYIMLLPVNPIIKLREFRSFLH